MDRVTRYPIFSIPDSLGLASFPLNGDTSYTFELVDVGPMASGWDQDQPQVRTADPKARHSARTAAPGGLRAFPCQPFLQPEDEGEEMKAYLLEAGDAVSRHPQDLQQEWWAVRKSDKVATFCGTSDHGDSGTPCQLQSTPLEENGIDREQIDFLAARQQFLRLEQENVRVLQNAPARAATTCAPPRVGQAPKALNGLSRDKGDVVSVPSQVKEEKPVRGLFTGSGARAVNEPGSWSPVESLETSQETPIEREIRLAQEREAALRKQRGLQRAASHQELVEIPARPLLTKVRLSAAPRRGWGRPSLYVQRDLVQETQREEDHRREALQAGRSTPDWASEDARPGLGAALSVDSILGLAPDASAADSAPEVRKVNRIPSAAYLPYLSPRTPRQEPPALRAYSKPGGLSAEKAKAVASPKATGSQRPASASSGKPSGTYQERPKPPRAVVRREYFRLRPLRFRVPDESQKPEPPRSWGWQVAGAPGLRLHKSQSELLEKEVERVLRREQEVAEERRNALFPDVFSPPPEAGRDQDSRSSSQASGIMGSYSVTESHFFSPIHLHPRLLWTAEGPPEYAGINPSDQVNSEVLKATRVTRHKNDKAERWEAGVYTSEDED